MVVLGTMALFWPATRCDFVNLDDGLHVTANARVQSGLSWENIKWAFLNPVANNWHPLTVLSHMLDCQMFGLRPWGHHLTNVLLHALNAGLVFGLLQAMTGARWRSLLVAALFAVHPLRVESVAWVTERKDVLSAFFGLLALVFYARYAEGRGRKSEGRRPRAEGNPKSKARSPKPEAIGLWSVVGSPSTLRSATEDGWSLCSLPSSLFYLLSLCFFALGLMSKPMLVTWPFVMLLLDYWPLGRTAEGGMRSADSRNPSTLRSAATEDGSTLRSPPSAVPLRRTGAATEDGHHVLRFTFHVSRPALLPLFLEKLPFFALSAIASVVTFVVQQRGGALAVGESLPLSARLGNALISYCRYLGKLFWPTELAVVYPHPGQWPLGKVVLAGGVILGLSLLVWVQRRRYPYLLMGWLWYCGTLVPVSQVIQTGAHAMADRWTYLPSLGVLILTVWGAGELTRRWRYQALALSVAGGGAIVLCLALTRHQLGYWQDSEVLLRHALAVTENNDLAHKNLGAALYQQGQIDEAIRQFQEGVRLKPDDADTHYNLGVALDKQGQIDEAIRQFQEAIRLKPDLAPAHNNLGTALGLTGQTDEAIRQFQEALRLKPDYAEARKNLDAVLATKAQASPPPGATTNP
jgi:hypothetical protein